MVEKLTKQYQTDFKAKLEALMCLSNTELLTLWAKAGSRLLDDYGLEWLVDSDSMHLSVDGLPLEHATAFYLSFEAGTFIDPVKYERVWRIALILADQVNLPIRSDKKTVWPTSHKSSTRRRFESQLRNKGIRNPRLKMIQGSYLDTEVQAMWVGYEMGVDDMRDNATGTCIIGKSIDGGRVEFVPKPYVHRNYRLASKELSRLAHDNRDQVYVLFQSQTSLRISAKKKESVVEESLQ